MKVLWERCLDLAVPPSWSRGYLEPILALDRVNKARSLIRSLSRVPCPIRHPSVYVSVRNSRPAENPHTQRETPDIVAFPENSSGRCKIPPQKILYLDRCTQISSPSVRQITHTQTPSTFPTHSTRAVDFVTRQPKPGTSSLKADRLPLSRASPPLRLLSAKSQGERPLAFAKHVHLATASHPAPGRAMIARWMRAIAAGNL